MYASIDEVSKERKLILRSLDNTVDCGCRFRYVAPEIPLDYNELVKAIGDAIDKEAAENDNKFVTDERETAVADKVEYDYDKLMEEFGEITGKLMSKDSTYYGPRITQIVATYLGKGKKVSETTRDQAEFIHLIVSEMKDEFKDVLK